MSKLTHSTGPGILGEIEPSIRERLSARKLPPASSKVRVSAMPFAIALLCWPGSPLATQSGDDAGTPRHDFRALAARSGGETMAQRILRRSSPHRLPVVSPPTPSAELRPDPAGKPETTLPKPGAEPEDSVTDSTSPGRGLLNSFTPPSTPSSLSPIAMSNLRRYDDVIERHSRMNGIDPNLVRAVIYVESAGNPKAVSSKGARGPQPNTALTVMVVPK